MADQFTSTPKKELSTLSVRDLFYKYVRYLPVFMLSVAITLFGAYAYLRYATPIYSVSGTIYIKSDDQGGRSDKFEEMFVNDKAANIASEIEVLKSRPLMERVVQSLGLQFNYYAKGKIKTVDVYKYGAFTVKALEVADSSQSFSLKVKFLNSQEFTVNDSDLKIKFNQVFKNQYGVFMLVPTGASVGHEYEARWVPTQSMAGALAGSLVIVPKTAGTGILTISLQTANSQQGADVINQLMTEYRQYNIDEKKSSSDSILAFIDGRLAEYGHALDSAQRDLLVFQQKNDLIDVETQYGNYFTSIQTADESIELENSRLAAVNLVNDYLSDRKNEFSKVPSTISIEDLTLREIVTGYNNAQLERQQLIDANVPVDNPRVQEADNQIEKLRTMALENLKNLKKAYGGNVNALKQRSGSAQTQLRGMPFKVMDYVERKRRVEGLQNLYKILQEQKESTSISRASTIANSKVVDRAMPSGIPVKPNGMAIKAFAILIGLLIPAGVIFIGEILNDKVSSRFDVEKLTSVPIVGEVGHSFSDSVLIVNKTTRSMVAEQFRIIRSNLQYVLGTNVGEKFVVLVTSSFSGEGKSFVSTNMGAVLSLTGKKTVILEFDIRKPKVLSGLNMTKGPGITNFLVGKAEIDTLIRPVDGYDELFVIGCGPVPPNPAELLLDEKVSELFSELKKRFDVIIIDTAPIGMVSDAMTLGKFADCSLYLVRQGHTFKKQVALIDEFYQDGKLPKISIVINDVKLKAGYGYYGYGRYGYGYGYGYGSYYEEEHAPRTFLDRVVNFFDIRRWFKKKK